MIYLDNHATTPCDPRVVERMLPFLTESFGNPHSTAHEIGREAATAVETSIASIAGHLGVSPDTVVMTSGATESNNLAIDGVCRHPRQRRRHVITTTIDHPSVLDVVARLEKDGFRVTRVPIHPNGHERVGQVNLDRLRDAVDDDTALVSIHWANNEIGVIQPMREIAAIAHACGALLHSDATQAVGRIPVNPQAADVDLVSASAHKFYGPKGVGFLTIAGGAKSRRVRLRPIFLGGGQQRSLRGGTMASANIVACAAAFDFAANELHESAQRIRSLRDRLWEGLSAMEDRTGLNGPSPDSGDRLPGNLNVMLPDIEGETWMSATPTVAFSSGSACSSVDPKPSHVLTGLGLSESEARRSVRFGVGKFNTDQDLDAALEQLADGYRRVRSGS